MAFPVAPVFHPTTMPYNTNIKEYSRDHRAWVQDGNKFRGIKSHKAFIWPKDGRNGSKWGRMKDILQDKGPDIHIAMSADKMDYMKNRQHKSRWADWTCLDNRDRDVSMSSVKYAPWTHNGALGGRAPGLSYDFRTRKYGQANPKTWTDIKWQPEPNGKHMFPEALRSFYGDWYQDNNYIPLTKRYPRLAHVPQFAHHGQSAHFGHFR
ncbi:hypothetical protein N0V87_006629 [Didymella glomerata]|uniref:Uncharacterized protein n=1 Tax=Didymella glomerata TaxID=749621 RepID=A0A9W9BXU1_9PLEO|nr:hypothetical protein N0V87_006629 [Didymella glomerata]